MRGIPRAALTKVCGPGPSPVAFPSLPTESTWPPHLCQPHSSELQPKPPMLESPQMLLPAPSCTRTQAPAAKIQIVRVLSALPEVIGSRGDESFAVADVARNAFPSLTPGSTACYCTILHKTNTCAALQHGETGQACGQEGQKAAGGGPLAQQSVAEAVPRTAQRSGKMSSRTCKTSQTACRRRRRGRAAASGTLQAAVVLQCTVRSARPYGAKEASSDSPTSLLACTNGCRVSGWQPLQRQLRRDPHLPCTSSENSPAKSNS